jgi:hypothetical protein
VALELIAVSSDFHLFLLICFYRFGT